MATGGIQANATTVFVQVDGAPAIGADGRWIAFVSSATNLAAGDTNGSQDVFVHDRQTGTTSRVSLGQGGVQANSLSRNPAISADGGFVALESFAGNLVAGDTNGVSDVFVRDMQAGTTTRVSVATGGAQGNGASGGAAISADGRWVVFGSSATNLVAGDTNSAGRRLRARPAD